MWPRRLLLLMREEIARLYRRRFLYKAIDVYPTSHRPLFLIRFLFCTVGVGWVQPFFVIWKLYFGMGICR